MRERTITSPIAFGGFLQVAKAGDRCVYHTGCLIDDRQTHAHVHVMAEFVAFAADLGLVLLHQVRVSDGLARYVAVRTRRKGWAS